MVKIAVIGAGIVGLTTANIIQHQIPEAEVTVLADKFNRDTTSDGAAGLFRPTLNLKGPNPEDTRQWLTDAYLYYKRFLDSSIDEALKAGIKEAPGYFLSTKYPSLVKNPFLESVVEEFRNCSEEEMKKFPPKVNHGSFLRTMVIECRIHLPYLMRKLKSKGCKFIEKTVETFDELSDNYDVICNCSGLGSRLLCNDEQLTPIRGQVFKVRAPWVKDFVYLDHDTYILPGITHVTLGGTRNYDSWREEVDRHDSAAILERCVEVIPSLKDAEVLEEWVGFRPFRPVVRVEKELIVNSRGSSIPVVHQYGHGSYGVLSAPGTAIHAVKLVKECFGAKSKL